MKFKNILISIFLLPVMSLAILSVFSVIPVNASSLTTVCNDSSHITAGSAGSSSFCKDKSTTNPARGILIDAINIITAIAGFVSVVMIVISGLQLVSSSGNSEKVSTARNTILYATIGLVVIALARIIVGFIISKVS
jgi:hypothetical protein